MKRRDAGSDPPGRGAKPLPDAELEVLACLWRRGEATARQIREAMEGYRPMAHGSVVTLLKRLQAKRWVTRYKGPVGKAFVYKPTRPPGPTYRKILGQMLRRIFAGNGVAMVSNLLESKPPTPKELDRLEKLLAELRSRARGKGDGP